MVTGEVEVFGTTYKPNARWPCKNCGRSNVSRLLVPIRERERVSCRGCHRLATLAFDLKVVPSVWGGEKIV